MLQSGGFSVKGVNVLGRGLRTLEDTMPWLAKMQHFPESDSGKKSSCFITNGRHPIRQSVHWPEIAGNRSDYQKSNIKHALSNF